MNQELSFSPLDYSTGASLFFLPYLLLHVPAAVPTYQVHFMFFCFFLATTLEPKSQQTVVMSQNDHEKAKELS